MLKHKKASYLNAMYEYGHLWYALTEGVYLIAEKSYAGLGEASSEMESGPIMVSADIANALRVTISNYKKQ